VGLRKPAHHTIPLAVGWIKKTSPPYHTLRSGGVGIVYGLRKPAHHPTIPYP